MATTNLEKLSKEELIQIIKNSDREQEQDFNISDFNVYNFSDLMDSASDIVCVVDKNYKIQYLNEVWRQTFPSKFFAASFFLALFLSALIELWFYSSISKEKQGS